METKNFFILRKPSFQKISMPGESCAKFLERVKIGEHLKDNLLGHPVASLKGGSQI
jgi:hypothetical protein